MLRECGRFCIAIRQAGRSVRTCELYCWHIEKLIGWLESRGVSSVREVSRDQLREWGAAIRDGWSPATCKSAVCSVRAWFRWLKAENIILSNAAEALVVPTVPERVQRTVSSDEVRLMLAQCDLTTMKGLRDFALINVLIDTGLRSSEVCGVQCARVDLVARVLVAKLKGGNESPVFFGASTAAAVSDWLSVRAAAPGVRTLFVSCGGSYPGKPLTSQGLRTILRKLGGKAGLMGITTHAFRRGFACVAIEAGAPSRFVQLAGRWSNIGMVERYTKALRGEQLYSEWSPADRINSDRDGH